MMKALDKDCNGYIDYQEFISASTNKLVLLSKQNLLAAFRTFDSDGSGKVSAEELKQVFDTVGNRKDSALWSDIVSEVDSNGDKMIDFGEFTEVMQRLIVDHHS